jgi:hypothetical protein
MPCAMLWYRTSYLLDRDQSMNGMARKRYLNYKKQPLEMKFGKDFKGTFESLGLNPDRWKAQLSTSNSQQQPQGFSLPRLPSSVRKVPTVSVRWPIRCGWQAST